MSSREEARSPLLSKPLYGGLFGDAGRFAIATIPCVSRGLHATRYMVVEPRGGAVLSIAEDKVEALAGARRVLAAANDPRTPVPPAAIQMPLWSDEPALEVQPGPPLVHVSRRRRAIFERTAGKCFYCGGVLQLDGKWHVEHQQPRALGGGDDPLNLVAACTKCNLAKSDRTALEFIASR